MAHGTGIGIGLFLLLIAANGVGLVIKNPLDGLPVALGGFHDLSGDDVVGGAGSDYRPWKKLKVPLVAFC